jgi:hypothetical protein
VLNPRAWRTAWLQAPTVLEALLGAVFGDCDGEPETYAPISVRLLVNCRPAEAGREDKRYHGDDDLEVVYSLPGGDGECCTFPGMTPLGLGIGEARGCRSCSRAHVKTNHSHASHELHWKRGPNAHQRVLSGGWHLTVDRDRDPSDVCPWQPQVPCSMGLDDARDPVTGNPVLLKVQSHACLD